MKSPLFKSIASSLSLLALVSFLFISCGGKTEDKKEEAPEQTEKMENPDDEPAITH